MEPRTEREVELEGILRAILRLKHTHQNAKKPWAINKPWFTFSCPGPLLERMKHAMGDNTPLPIQPATPPNR